MEMKRSGTVRVLCVCACVYRRTNDGVERENNGFAVNWDLMSVCDIIQGQRATEEQTCV